MSFQNQREPITPAIRTRFPIGAGVRYKPGLGTYGYEDGLEADGCVPGVVVGYTNTRVRIEVTLVKRGGTRKRAAVHHDNLVLGATR